MTEPPNDTAPKPPLLRKLLRRLRPRFSLRTLLVFMLLLASAFLLWLHWEPWVPAAKLDGMPDRDALLAFSRDGERLVGTAGLTVFVWDAATGRVLARRPCHRTRDNAYSDTLAGPLVACTGPDPLVARSKSLDEAGVEVMRARLSFKVSFPGGWEAWMPCREALRRLQELLEKEGPDDVLFELDLAPNGEAESWILNGRFRLNMKDAPWCEVVERVAEAGQLGVRYEDGLVVLYPLTQLSEQDPAVERNVRVWDLETGALVKDLEGPGDRVTQLLFELGGRFLIARTETYAVRVWRTSDWSVLADLPQDFPGLGPGVSVSDDGRWMTSRVLLGSSVRLWRSADVTSVRSVELNGLTAKEVFSPDGTRLFVNVTGKGGKLLATDPAVKLAEWQEPGLSIFGREFPSYAFTPDGTRLLALDSAVGPRVRSAETGELLPLPPEASEMVSIEDPGFAPDGLRILTRSLEEKTIRVWDLRDYRELAALRAYTENPDRDRLFGLLNMDVLPPEIAQKEVDPADAAPISMNPEMHVWINRDALILSPDGNRVVAEDHDYGMIVWQRRRPEWWWGVAWLPEFWLTVVFALALAWSLRRDWKHLRHASPKPSVPGT